MGPRYLLHPHGARDTGGKLPAAARAKLASEDVALAGRLRKRLSKKNGDDVSDENASYMVNALRRAPAIGENTVRLLFSMLEHAKLENPERWAEMFDAVRKKCPNLDEILPPERVVTVVHELADKLDRHKKLDDEAVMKLLALGTVRGIPNIRTRRALEAIRRVHPMTQSADKLMKTRLADIPIAPKKPWTIFIYMASENNLESYAVNDIEDMEKTFAKIAPFANVVVLADGGVVNDEDKSLGPQPANNWSSKSRLILIEEAEKNGQVMSRTIPVPYDSPLGELMSKGKGELNLASPDTLTAAYDFVHKGIPSDKTFFSVWSHGLAWKGIAEDTGGGAKDMLRPHELLHAFGQAERVPDVMGFDACLMSNSGVTALLDELGVEYLVGSEELLDAEGWGYHRVFDAFADAHKAGGDKLTPEALAHSIVDKAHGTTLSAVRVGAASKIWGGLDKLGEALMAAGGRNNPEIQELVETLPRYGSYGVDASEEDQALGDEEVVDVIHMCKELQAKFPNSDIATAAARLEEITDGATHHKNMPSPSYPGIEDYSYGLTTYLPRKSDAFATHYLGRGAVWKDQAPTWINFLKQKVD